MRCLVVLAHPLPQSLNTRFAQLCHETLEHAGHDVRFLDLYASGFDPVLSPQERADYYEAKFKDQADLTRVEVLVLVFPTWWFAMPAILKGWIDRSFLPGVAYDHASDLSALSPKLTALRQVLVVTTLGSPRWVDLLILRRPVLRSLKWGVFKACAPQARFRMLSLYGAETVTEKGIAGFEARIRHSLPKPDRE